MAFDEDKTYEAILRLHDKVDEQAKDIRQVSGCAIELLFVYDFFYS